MSEKNKLEFGIMPLNGRIIVEPCVPEECSSGGIFIPDTAKDRPQLGTVLAVAADIEGECSYLEPGNTVVYAKYAGDEFKIEGRNVLILKSEDLLGLIRLKP